MVEDGLAVLAGGGEEHGCSECDGRGDGFGPHPLVMAMFVC